MLFKFDAKPEDVQLIFNGVKANQASFTSLYLVTDGIEITARIDTLGELKNFLSLLSHFDIR